jgi:hypothetical protein
MSIRYAAKVAALKHRGGKGKGKRERQWGDYTLQMIGVHIPSLYKHS